MEYLGNIKRDVDCKRRIKFPAEWIDDSLETEIFFVKGEKHIKIFSYGQWKNKIHDLGDDDHVIEFAKNSTKRNIDKSHRIILPDYIKSENVILIGVVDYIVIEESAE